VQQRRLQQKEEEKLREKRKGEDFTLIFFLFYRGAT
jgi:hypothetical protein